jgi:hypothetical protein
MSKLTRLSSQQSPICRSPLAALTSLFFKPLGVFFVLGGKPQ